MTKVLPEDVKTKILASVPLGRMTLNAAAALGMNDDSLHIAIHRHNNLPVGDDRCGRRHIYVIALDRRASADRVHHPQQNMAALRNVGA